MMFTQITIIGMGLIGSSLARCISQQGLCERLIAVDADEDVCAYVEARGLADSTTTNAIEGVQGSDLVILCVPTGAIGKLIESIAPVLMPKSILSDVGSVKQSVVNAILPHLPESVSFVPAHPIAGTEHSGPESGFAELFQERWCILTPTANTNIRAVEAITKLWEKCGAKIEIMDAAHHDLVFATTSHLPHLLAYAMVGTATTMEQELKSEVIKFSASGFRGATRLAASDPTMWRDVCLDNREAILESLGRFTDDLMAMQKAIKRGDGEFLFNRFTETRVIRREIEKLGPEGYPNPQRMAIDTPDEES